MAGMLVIVPCGAATIWGEEPRRGPTPAHDAYTGAPFKVNRAYAECFADRWVILSAKYGLIPPDFVISGPYEVTFKDRSTGPIALGALREQAHEQVLQGFPLVVGLGGRKYRDIVRQVFEGSSAQIRFPFAGLPIGMAMLATNAAARSGNPFGDGRNNPGGAAGRTDRGEQPVAEAYTREPRSSTVAGPPSAENFRHELEAIIRRAALNGRSYVDVNAGELHRRVGGYPGRNHRMPVCCQVLLSRRGSLDRVIQAPPSAKGASLTIRYRIGPSST